MSIKSSLSAVAASRRAGSSTAAAIPHGPLIDVGALPAIGDLPVVIRPATPTLDLVGWASASRRAIDEYVAAHGAVLFRGFGVRDVATLEAFARATSDGGLLDYTYASTPRTRLAGAVYTSTEYPADQTIPMHNEMSYFSNWPGKIWFCCLTPAASGGETPLARSAAVARRLDPALRARFRAHGVTYIRNYGSRLDLPIAQVFGTSDKAEIERFCAGSGVDCEWHADGLTTRQTCQAEIVHPGTGEPLWFNQAHLFHVSSLGETAAAELIAQLGEDRVPRHACFGDGAPIPVADLEEIRRAFEREQFAFAWEAGDVLLLDNMRIAHGRHPYTGARRVAVAMAERVAATSGH